MSHPLGRYHAPEPPSAIRRLHFHQPTKTALKTVDHEPTIGVLDQEDLLQQGIRCSEFIPGAGNPNELGSCTCNTLVEALSNILTPAEFAAFLATMGAQQIPGDQYADPVAGERAAIGCYHQVTDQTGEPASEWPPTDCGSSGPYLYQWAIAQKLIATERIAHGAQNIVSLMQPDGVLIGTPWFNAWFEPDASGFIDGNGTIAALKSAISSGIAGGHEIYGSAVEKLTVLPTGQVDPVNTVLRFRNHWTRSWADQGSGRVHLSTLVALGGNVDIRQFVK